MKCLHQAYLAFLHHSLLPSSRNRFWKAVWRRTPELQLLRLKPVLPPLTHRLSGKRLLRPSCKVKESLNAHHSSLGQHLQENGHKSTCNYRKNELSLLWFHMALLRAFSVQTRRQWEEDIFKWSPKWLQGLHRVQFWFKDGQNLGQPAMLGSARHQGQLAMVGLSQECLLFFTSQDRYWNFCSSSCSLFMFWQFISSWNETS